MPGAHVVLLSRVGLGVGLEVAGVCSAVVALVPGAPVRLLSGVGPGVDLERAWRSKCLYTLGPSTPVPPARWIVSVVAIFCSRFSLLKSAFCLLVILAQCDSKSSLLPV